MNRRFGTSVLTAICLVLLVYGISFAHEPSSIETRLVNFIQDFYGGEEQIQVKFVNGIPSTLKGKQRIRHINFSKIPDSHGNGICIIEFEGKNTRGKNAYIPFKIFKKRRLFVLRQGVNKGDAAASSEIQEKHTYLSGEVKYPTSKDDITGKRFKKDLPAGTVITPDILEDHVLVKRGEVVNVRAENARLVVHAKGKALDRGRLGETIRIKNMTSGKEVLGKVTGSGLVAVQF